MSLFSVFLFMLAISGTVDAGVIQDPSLPWCLDRDASADLQQLRCLHEMAEAQALRSELREFLRRRMAYPTCQSSVIDGDRYATVFDSPYMVIAITLTRMITGIDMHVVFKKQPLQEYRIWLDYETESYKLGLVDARPRTKTMAKLLERFQSKQYDDFWVKDHIP